MKTNITGKSSRTIEEAPTSKGKVSVSEETQLERLIGEHSSINSDMNHLINRLDTLAIRLTGRGLTRDEIKGDEERLGMIGSFEENLITQRYVRNMLAELVDQLSYSI